MRPITVVVIVGVVIATGFLISPILAESTVSVSFDAKKVPVGFMDVVLSEKEVSNRFDNNAPQKIIELDPNILKK